MTTEEWKRIFANRLGAAIDDSGMDRKEVAIRANLSPASISQYLSGNQIPTAYAATNLARVLGVETDYLVNFDKK